MITKEVAQELMERIVAESLERKPLTFRIETHEGYLLLALVQLAVSHPDIPEIPKEFGETFIKAFCDRYREELPAMVESFELADQENFLMSREEFEDLIPEDNEWDFI